MTAPTDWMWDRHPGGLHYVMELDRSIVATIDAKRQRPGNTARFIAAGPEVFAALLDTLHELKLYSVDVDDDDLRATIARANAAIARARTTPKGDA